MNTLHRTRIINLIKESPDKLLSVSQIHKNLVIRFPGVTHNQNKKALIEVVEIDRKLKKEGKKIRYSISPNKGGKSFRFTGGGETTRKGTGAYREISKVMNRNSKNIIGMFFLN